MAGRLNRRHALRILGAGAVLGLGAVGLGTMRGQPEPKVWRGEVLGAVSAMTLWHPNPRVAERTIGRMLVEIDRLDRIFSLYRKDSELVQLNSEGRLAEASADLVLVFEESLRIAHLSNGAFDPSIQPLWQFKARGGGSKEELGQVLGLVDHAAIDLGARSIGFARPGMAATLNGIAQGHITDRITDLLVNDGFEQAMVELGETRALGSAPGGRPFAVGLVDPADPRAIARQVELASAGLAVSGGYGLRLDAEGGNHVIDPATGTSPGDLTQVAVISPRSIWADALSTAISVAGEAAAPRLLAAYPESRAILWRADGTVVEA
ncbi:thiamine biosynthesis lipoprotein [Devosia enhydra]|uniref:FAD:protein FMN transferase n=1 Tax=Devosia enhydra TaxID=665118 RepID=A0A1K2I3R9_9HYPH|nr:FAD:protein FMN transferase [Devosia enhydra]SFZ86879.1 thiamine biosynthesis lipoprotein [Devosia enhydra]